jgi:hypothetical protein
MPERKSQNYFEAAILIMEMEWLNEINYSESP